MIQTSDAELLRHTAARLQRLGWQRKAYGNSAGPNCLVGALLIVGGAEFIKRVVGTIQTVLEEQYPDAARVHQCRYLPNVLSSHYGAEAFLFSVNDDVFISKDEPIAILEKAATKLEEAL